MTKEQYEKYGAMQNRLKNNEGNTPLLIGGKMKNI